MNVILYTINDAESDFCKQAKDFLTAHNIPFENKDVEHDRTALSAMLAISDNFSGVPVMVVGEGADQKVVKGFTQEEFEQALGLSAQPEPAVVTPQMQDSVPTPTQWPVGEQKLDQNIPQVDQNASMPAAAPVMPPVEPVAPVFAAEPVAPVTPAAPGWSNEPTTTESVAPVVPLTPPVDASHDDELKGIMDTLSQNGMPSAPVTEPVAAEPAPTLEIPVDDHPVNPVVEEPVAPAVTPPAEFTAAAPASPEPVTSSVTEPSTWANQPASAMPAAPSAPAAPAWNAQPSAPVEPAAPVADMPSVPDFPQK